MKNKETDIKCNVKKLRVKEGWSQGELAEKIGVRRQAVYDIESGRYLPNTAIALKLAQIFGCRVEDVFEVEDAPDTQPVHVVSGESSGSKRLTLGRVRDRLVGLPLEGSELIPFGLRPADGLLSKDGKSAQILSSPDLLEKTIILMGCDPAFEILSHHVARVAPETRVHCRFASSHRALSALADGVTHVAGTHLHNTGGKEANVVVATEKLKDTGGSIIGFSVLEEGLLVAKGNPMGIRTVADLAQPMVRFINREKGAALRVLLDDWLHRENVDPQAIPGYDNTVSSHREGAYRIACNVADAALGMRAIAETYDLGFVPIMAARCDLVIPNDVMHHPTVKILMDVLQSNRLRKEIDAIPGYDGTVIGKLIAEV